MARNFNSNSNNRNNRSSNRGASQPMMSGWADTAKERPFATAAAVGGAVAAGVFLWSRRNQISDQLSNMSDQISDWSENMRSEQGQSSMQSGQSGASSPSAFGARSSTPTGTESLGQPEMAGAGTSSATGATRATGGRSGKAQSGQSLNPSRSASDTNY